MSLSGGLSYLWNSAKKSVSSGTVENHSNDSEQTSEQENRILELREEKAQLRSAFTASRYKLNCILSDSDGSEAEARRVFSSMTEIQS